MHHSLDYYVAPGGRLQGRIAVPGDKSISHRAVMLGAIAQGRTEIEGLLEGEDVLATVAAFRAMGVNITGPHKGQMHIDGVGLGGLRSPDGVLDMGNSGTAMRLLCGLLAGQAFSSKLTGDSSLLKRPMARVATPLNSMGAVIECGKNNCPPLHIRGGQALKGMEYAMPVASAQVKSAILLAGLYAQGRTTVIEPAPSRDHTERMLRGLGYTVVQQPGVVSIEGGGRLQAHSLQIPGDISSAAFFIVGAVISSGSDVVLENTGVNPTRLGVITILKAMGAKIDLENERVIGGEPVADIHVQSSQLHGINIPQEQVPLAIDEFPAILIAAACAEGETILSGAKELRVKESDRIQAMAKGLQSLGVEVQEAADGAVIQGKPSFSGAIVESHDDHRIAMAFAVAGLRARAGIRIKNCKNVDTSFPGFAELAARAGLQISVSPAEFVGTSG
ncbi:MAG: 3-phosphoshikimate 1-carboxyvinyltransferase [Gammaproteobacteria bacterium]|nr:3-phosphoshikimate 1-carboxyvinyltransferase [Gammaproteobacteria bacterium]